MMAEGEFFNCTALEEGQFVGPVQVYQSIHHWNTAVYLILAIHAIPVWLVSTQILLRLRSTVESVLRGPLVPILLTIPLLMVLASVGIIIPSSGPLVQLVSDIVITVGMCSFVLFTTRLSGGSRILLQRCNEHKIGLPIAAPPFVCLAVVKQPLVTLRKIQLIQWLPLITILVKLALLAIRIYEFVSYPPGELPISGLARYLSIPVALVGVYTYTIYVILVAQALKGSPVRTLGFVLLGLFVLSDALELFFLFLTGTKMLTCVAPALPLSGVEHLLKNCIKGFITTTVGLPYLKICSGKHSVLQL